MKVLEISVCLRLSLIRSEGGREGEPTYLQSCTIEHPVEQVRVDVAQQREGREGGREGPTFNRASLNIQSSRSG